MCYSLDVLTELADGISRKSVNTAITNAAVGTTEMVMGGSSEILSEEEVRVVVRRTVKTTDFRVRRYDVKPASETPTGFLGEHMKVRVDVTLGTGETTQFFYFVKSMPRSVPQHLEYAISIRAFYKEIELYKTLFIDMKNAQSVDKPTKWCPEYYYSKGEDVIVVEDLSHKGFYMLPERTLMDEEHIRASLKAVAAMHAASFVFEEKLKRGMTDSLSPNRQKLAPTEMSLYHLYSHLTYETEVSDLKGHPGNRFVQVGITSQTSIVPLLDKYNQQDKQKIQEKLPDVLRRIFPLVKPSNRYRNVFIHGDLWANNLLFRREDNGMVEEAAMVDFQLARYAPPAHDLMMFFYLVQDQHFRNKKQDEMLNYYYQCLTKELEGNDVAIAQVLPKEEFLESCRYYRELGSVTAVLYFQLIMAPPSTSAKFMASPELYQKVMFVDRSEMIAESFKTDEKFRKRMTEAMEDIIQNYIFS